MKISELITEQNIILHLDAKNKEEIIDSLANRLEENGFLENLEEFKKDIWEREEAVSTEVGYGIAMPHTKSAHVNQPAVIFGRNLEGITYDKEKCNLFFMIAAQADATDEHLKTLSRLSTYLMDELFRARLILAQTVDDVISVINDKEQEEVEEEKIEESISNELDTPSLVGVTACTAGIAHTYMSAQSLRDAAEKRGIKMKVQTDGSSGTENRLTDEEIAQADGVIIAADRTVDMSRFDGKKVVETSTKRGINNADELISEVLSKKELYKATDSVKSDSNSNDAKKSGVFDIYKHLMNGVSFMLPFVVSGGILIAISFMFGVNSANPDSSQYNEFAAFLNSVGGSAAFGLMVPIFAGYVAFSIADRPGLAPGAIGGMIASTGGSGFLGGLIAGFVAGYSILLLKKILIKLPKSLHGLNPVLLYPVLGTLITTIIIQYVINTPISSFNDTLVRWLTDMNGSNAILVGALLGGILVSDMGGPLNKIAYAFGIQMITAGVYEPMAALMCGGMIPPIGLGLATTFFRNKFTEQDRETGKIAYVLGSCFITEGVIPFAAADPIRVIPANIIGAAVGGALSMAFGIELTAPHGGIFVIPIAINRPFLYIACVLAGSAVTMLIVGLTKKSIVPNKKTSGGITNVSDVEGAI
ncbi:PTS fructose transporter subunit IIABC [Enterococcus xiangfangensis]|uniref:PTS fructose transporter subunit IIABC n=1 Tax=Enterococcus xiangfangensis TaxID=1296537 RepID=UPI0010F72F86|nr:PTS fructose transporter subunit IIABC [Enterococcus xiangfangensis]MBM7712417.1 PTS system fructose-specific IIC component [Enterococcus xiangfangensis]NBK08906.1 PTS fructose transporter subunit IIA [Enterococcus asini]